MSCLERRILRYRLEFLRMSISIRSIPMSCLGRRILRYVLFHHASVDALYFRYASSPPIFRVPPTKKSELQGHADENGFPGDFPGFGEQNPPKPCKNTSHARFDSRFGAFTPRLRLSIEKWSLSVGRPSGVRAPHYGQPLRSQKHFMVCLLSRINFVIPWASSVCVKSGLSTFSRLVEKTMQMQ